MDDMIVCRSFFPAPRPLLTSNINLSSAVIFKKDVNLDLGGHTVSAAGNLGCTLQVGTKQGEGWYNENINVDKEKLNVTLKNGTVTNSGTQCNVFYCYDTNVKVDATIANFSNIYCILPVNSKITIEGGEWTSETNPVIGTNAAEDYGTFEVIVNGGTLKTKDKDHAICATTPGKVTINEGSIIGGIQTYAADVVINGGSLRGTRKPVGRWITITGPPAETIGLSPPSVLRWVVLDTSVKAL